MRPEHRHELKTNALAEWIGNFPQWLKENARMIIYMTVLVVAVGGLYYFRRYKTTVVAVKNQTEFTQLVNSLQQSRMRIIQAQAQGMDISYALIQPADSLLAIGQKIKNEHMAALALIKRAETLRMELHYRFGEINSQDLKGQIEMAKASYNEALDKLSQPGVQQPWSSPSLAAMAKFGLGLCAEEFGSFEEAKQIYSELAESKSFDGTVALVQAENRLGTMANYQQKVTFLAAPVQVQPEAAPFELTPQLQPTAPEESLELPKEATEQSANTEPNK